MSSGLESLKSVVDEKPRNSRGILEYGTSLLSKFNSGLGDDVWEVREKVFLAALDEYDLQSAERELKQIEKRFPDSIRMKKLKALLLEVKGEFKEAKQLYTTLEKEDEHDKAATKRKIAIMKTQGHVDAARKALGEYLEVFQSDQDAWKELALLNVDIGNYEAASFCFEELVLFTPTNPFYHLACAECMYTEGGARSVLDARKYISQSLVIRPIEKGNLRAVFDLALTTHTIQKRAGDIAPVILEDEDAEEIESLNRKLNKWACDKLVGSTSSMVPGLQDIVKSVVEDFRVESK
mmetsp:Transcript_13790/g.15719  ORF Transcript_13790/g.15719 Transcript_13790/m.15719 type:complete len:294 (+) Transcript_13790:150-1031(+)